MKLLITLVLLLGSLVSNARTLEGFSGRIYNHSGYPLENFEIQVSWTHWKRDLLGSKKSLDSGLIPMIVSPNGQFSIPETNLGFGHHHTVYVSFTAKNTEASGYPRAFRSFDLEDKEINKLPELIREISIYFSKSQPVPVKLASGKDSKIWLQQEAPETFLETSVEFKGAKEAQPIYLEERFFPAFFEGNIPARIYFILGNLGERPSVQTKLAVKNYSFGNQPLASGSLSAELNQQTPFAEVLLADQSFPLLDRQLNGDYPILLYLDTKANYARNMFDGVLSLNCESDGTLTGRLKAEPRGGNSHKGSLDQEITGSCDGKTATLQFQLQLGNLNSSQTLDGLILGVVYRGKKKHLRGEHTSITGRDTPFTDIKLDSQDLTGRLEVK